MFKLAQENRFWWRTEIHVPAGDEKKIVHCDIEFRTGADDKDALERYAAGKLPEVDWIGCKIADWKNVGDDDGNPLPCTPEHIARFLAIDYVRHSVVNGYLKATNGLAHVRKN